MRRRDRTGPETNATLPEPGELPENPGPVGVNFTHADTAYNGSLTFGDGGSALSFGEPVGVPPLGSSGGGLDPVVWAVLLGLGVWVYRERLQNGSRRAVQYLAERT